MGDDDNRQKWLYHTHRHGCDNGNVGHHIRDDDGNDNEDPHTHHARDDYDRDGDDGHRDGRSDGRGDDGDLLLHLLLLFESMTQKWLPLQSQKVRYQESHQKEHHNNRNQ